MVCPVCVVGGVAYVASRVFGFPDIVVAFVIGMLATSMAYWGNHIIAKKMEKGKRSACSNQYPIRDYMPVFSQIDWIVVK
jgi:nucleoside diphosphate kinase